MTATQGPGIPTAAAHTPRFAGRVARIAGEGAAAWEIHARAIADAVKDPSVIVLSVGDPDFDTPPTVVEAAVSALREGDTHYAEVRGRAGLRDAIGDHVARLGGPRREPREVGVFAGAQNALFAASLCLLSEGDEVVAIDPMYVTYEAYLGVSGATLVRARSGAQTGFRPDIDAIARAIGPRTRAIAFSDPNNPTGVVMDAHEVAAIAELARRHDLWVISDEVYASLAFERGHVPIASLPGMAARTASVSSVSKSHAMTGWRLGWLTGPEALIDHAENLALCMNYGLPGFVQRAAEVALRDGGEATATMRDAYRRRRDLVSDALGEVTGLTVHRPEAGMFLIADVRATGLSSRDFVQRLYADQRVSVLDGAAFGAGTDGCVRVSFATGEARLQEGCARVARFVASL